MFYLWSSHPFDTFRFFLDLLETLFNSLVEYFNVAHGYSVGNEFSDLSSNVFKFWGINVFRTSKLKLVIFIVTIIFFGTIQTSKAYGLGITNFFQIVLSAHYYDISYGANGTLSYLK